VSSPFPILSKYSFLLLLLCTTALAQEPIAKPADTPPSIEKATVARNEEKPALPFQIQLLETHIRFETNGDSRKEVHTIVKINDLAGARQFSRLGFDYNRAFQQVEIPLVKISHANGGTSEILPSAITDAPNPAVQNFPAYHDVRVKSVRILGLQDGDTIEYRVITTTTKHPLAPDFWLEHTFDRSGVVSEEIFILGLPLFGKPQVRINPATPPTSVDKPGDELPEETYRWDLKLLSIPETSGLPDVQVSTFQDWKHFSERLGMSLIPFDGRLDEVGTPEELRRRAKEEQQASRNDVIAKKAHDLTKEYKGDVAKLRTIYDFVSQKITTVDLALGSTGFVPRSAAAILSSEYATPEDKYILFASISRAAGLFAWPVLVGPCEPNHPPTPSLFKHLGIMVHAQNSSVWLDPSLEVAPFGLLPPGIGTCGIVPSKIYYPAASSSGPWVTRPTSSPMTALQKVSVEASLDTDGTLLTKVNYAMRGENELTLRVAFHQTPKERWKEVAGLLALSDGFRGTITTLTASDPMATKDPFTVEYEITLPKFVDWSKKPVRIPALLPQIALPDAPGKAAAKIELGTPLDVQTSMTLKLPEGTTVQTPAATSVARDYATFASKYDAHLNMVNVSRHINFVKRDIPADRASDYNAFLRAVQNDQAQMLVLMPLAPQAGAKQ
jgi:uncharacterized protein DUF3857